MDIRQFFFKYRSYTPIPIAILIIYFASEQKPYYLLGLLMLLFGESIRIWAVSYAGGKTRTRKVGAPALCTSGPYAFTRNPLYLGNMFMYIGITLVAGAPNIIFMILIIFSFFMIQYTLIVSLEEETLTNLFGEAYINYKKNVPPIFPRITPWKNKAETKRTPILKTLKTEKRTLQNVFLILALIFLKSQNIL
jgi:protein-S-isoprenylcysteine O-methyltransferase Ste14